MGDLKAKTNLEKIGFSDPDKKSSEHDEIQIWVYENIRQVLSVAPLKREETITEIKCSWEYPIIHQSGNYKSIIGYADLIAFAHSPFIRRDGKDDFTTQNVLIEVKTKIPVLGELIRQLTTYRNYLIDTPIIVVCPDNKFEGILKEQGFYFFQYQKPTQ